MILIHLGGGNDITYRFEVVSGPIERLSKNGFWMLTGISGASYDSTSGLLEP